MNSTKKTVRNDSMRRAAVVEQVALVSRESTPEVWDARAEAEERDARHALRMATFNKFRSTGGFVAASGSGKSGAGAVPSTATPRTQVLSSDRNAQLLRTKAKLASGSLALITEAIHDGSLAETLPHRLESPPRLTGRSGSHSPRSPRSSRRSSRRGSPPGSKEEGSPRRSERPEPPARSALLIARGMARDGGQPVMRE